LIQRQWFRPVWLSGKSGDVNILWQVVFLLLWLFRLALLGRIVIEFVRVFARTWRPAGPPAVAMEVLYASTDPPVKLFRKIIPTVKLGGVGFDLSIVVLLIIVWIRMNIVQRLAGATL
jgi:YggT family protein